MIEAANIIGLGLAIVGGMGSESTHGEIFAGVFWLGLALYLGSVGFVLIAGERS